MECIKKANENKELYSKLMHTTYSYSPSAFRTFPHQEPLNKLHQLKPLWKTASKLDRQILVKLRDLFPPIFVSC